MWHFYLIFFAGSDPSLLLIFPYTVDTICLTISHNISQYQNEQDILKKSILRNKNITKENGTTPKKSKILNSWSIRVKIRRINTKNGHFPVLHQLLVLEFMFCWFLQWKMTTPRKTQIEVFFAGISGIFFRTNPALLRYSHLVPIPLG